MNKGTILEQANPELILRQYNSKTLEEVFLILCQKRNKCLKSGQTITSFKPEVKVNYETKDREMSALSGKRNINNKIITSHRIKAMLSKYWILTHRRPLYLIMYFTVPLLALTSMRLSIGKDPYNIPAAVYNGDLTKNMSQRFIDSIDKTYIRINEFDYNKTAYDSVVRGNNYVSIVFEKNFSDTFETRLTDLLNMDDFEIDNSLIKIYIDFSNAAIGAFVLKYLLQAFKDFCDSLSSTIGQNLFRFVFRLDFSIKSQSFLSPLFPQFSITRSDRRVCLWVIGVGRDGTLRPFSAHSYGALPSAGVVSLSNNY